MKVIDRFFLFLPQYFLFFIHFPEIPLEIPGILYYTDNGVIFLCKRKVSIMQREEQKLLLSAARLHKANQSLEAAEKEFQALASLPPDDPQRVAAEERLNHLRRHRDALETRHLTQWMEQLSLRKLHES